MSMWYYDMPENLTREQQSADAETGNVRVSSPLRTKDVRVHYPRQNHTLSQAFFISFENPSPDPPSA